MNPLRFLFRAKGWSPVVAGGAGPFLAEAHCALQYVPVLPRLARLASRPLRARRTRPGSYNPPLPVGLTDREAKNSEESC